MSTPRTVIPKKPPPPAPLGRLVETAEVIRRYVVSDAGWLKEHCPDLYPCVECLFLAPGVKAMSVPVAVRHCLHTGRFTLPEWLKAGGAVNA